MPLSGVTATFAPTVRPRKETQTVRVLRKGCGCFERVTSSTDRSFTRQFSASAGMFRGRVSQ